MPLTNDQKLKCLLDLMEPGGMTSEDFLKYFSQVIAFVKAVQERNDKSLLALETELARAVSDLKSSNAEDFDARKNDIMSTLRKHEEAISKAMRELTDKVDAKLMEVRDGRDADEQAMIDAVLARIPAPEMPQPETPEILRDKLETLSGENRLDKSAIKGLEDKIAELEAKITQSKGGMRGMRKIPIVKRYRLTDQCNGVLKSFTLPADTTDVLGVFGSQFPINYDPYNTSGGDWTLSGRTLTLGSGVSAPETGQTLWALIETLFY